MVQGAGPGGLSQYKEGPLVISWVVSSGNYGYKSHKLYVCYRTYK